MTKITVAFSVNTGISIGRNVRCIKTGVINNEYQLLKTIKNKKATDYLV